VKWDFERMNELQIRVGRGGEEPGYVTVNANPKHGDYSHFQPGPGVTRWALMTSRRSRRRVPVAVAGGPAENSNVHDALSAAATVTAAEGPQRPVSAKARTRGRHHGITDHERVRDVDHSETFVALGAIDPDWRRRSWGAANGWYWIPPMRNWRRPTPCDRGGRRSTVDKANARPHSRPLKVLSPQPE